VRSSVKPWICLLTILMLCSVPAWASGSEPEKKAEGEKKEKSAAPAPEPSARVKAKMGQAPAPAPAPPDCVETDKPKISAIVNTFEDVYGHSGSLETLPEGAQPATAAQAATAVTWHEVDKSAPTPAVPQPAAQAEAQKEAEPRDDDEKKEAKKSGDQG